MKLKDESRWCVASLVLLMMLGVAGVAKAQRYESVQVPALTALIPQALVSSGQHRILSAHPAGPYRLSFNIETETGSTIEATTLAMAMLRIHEIGTLAQAVRQFETDTAQGPDDRRGQIRVGGDTLADILGSPLDTSTKVVNQFGRNVDRTLQELGRFPGPDSPASTRSSLPANDPILSSHRRNIANQLDLDIHSTNPAVHRFLDLTARARMNGLGRAGITTVALVRDKEVQVDAGGVRAKIRSAMLDEPINTLYRHDAQLLSDAGVSDAASKEFLDHPNLSVTQKTELSEYVHYLRDIDNAAALITATLDARDEVDARERIQVARMYAHYHEQLAPITRFVDSGHLPIALTRAGTLVVALPFDLLYWDKDAETVFDVLGHLVANNASIRSATLLLPGIVTPMARQALVERGFQVLEGFLFRH